ncbi:methyl-accepting chemotaxis protein [Novosphingobium sp.]|uniref:methyl-accepting chemotaxis protein n=1 Tax=Novosphingobium sp. TaxID=1874826 RepID=UPI0038BC34D3
MRFNISAKILAAFSLLLAVVAATGLVSIEKIGEVNALSAEMRTRWLPSAQALGDIHAYLSQYRIKQVDLVAAPSPRTEKLVRNAQAVIDGLLGDYAKHAESPQQKQSLGQLKQSWTAYTSRNEELTRLAQAHDANAKAMLDGEALDQFYAMEDTVLAMIDQDSKAASAVSAQSAAIYDQARMFMFGAIGAGLAVAVLLLVLLMHNIARPLKRMSEAVGRLVGGDREVALPGLGRSDEIGALAGALERFKDLFAADQLRADEEKARAAQTRATIDAIGGGLAALAEGKLDYHVPETGGGALAKLHADYNAAVGTLAGALGKIVTGCGTIRVGTHEIAAAAHDLANRSEQQASSIAETAKTLSEFSGAVKITADNARQTSSRLAVARATAGRVEGISHEAIGAMRSIEASSREMAEIVNVIDGIAFQTNLLALNAGVEAARAGESGKGFAVVATEVRALAQRSADAAKDIKALISTSTEQIVGGVTLVESSGEALRQIVGEVGSVSGLVDEIAEAAEKQASGIAEISGMVATMDQFTQQNAAMVEETSAGTRNLSEETEGLMAQLERFSLGGSGSALNARHDPFQPRATPRPVAYAPPSPPPPSPPPSPATTRAAPAFQGNAAVKADTDDWSEF